MRLGFGVRYLFISGALLLAMQGVNADGYSDGLSIVEEMSRTSTANLEAVLALQEQGKMLEAMGVCARIARQMKAQQDRVWQIYTRDCTIAVQSLYIVSAEQTRFWLAELNAFTMMARGMYDMAKLQLDQAKLCEEAFSASLGHASLCHQIGL